MATINLHWSDSKPNFGDALSPLICKLVSGCNINHSSIENCDLVAIGSLMQRVKERIWSKRIHVWGTGFISQEENRNSRHYLHAVRGKLTAKILRAGISTALGDPGLLASLLINKTSANKTEQKYKCLIIPHYKDNNHPSLSTLIEKNIPDIAIADVFQPCNDLLLKILSSEVVLSSAMHGLIAADSLGIPNAWIKLSDDVRGGDFKFRDYYSVFNIEPKSLNVNDLSYETLKRIVDTYSRPGLNEVKQSLIDSFPLELRGDA